MSESLQRKIRDNANKIHDNFSQLNQFLDKLNKEDESITDSYKKGVGVSSRKVPPIRRTKRFSDEKTNSKQIFEEDDGMNAQKFAKLKEEGNKLFRANKPEEAISAYKKCLRIENNPIIHGNIGACLDKLGRFEEAESRYTQALELDYGYVKMYYRRGIIRKKLRKYRLSLTDFQRGLTLKPDSGIFKTQVTQTKELFEKYCQDAPKKKFLIDEVESDDDPEDEKSEKGPETEVEEEEVEEEGEDDIEELVTPQARRLQIEEEREKKQSEWEKKEKERVRKVLEQQREEEKRRKLAEVEKEKQRQAMKKEKKINEEEQRKKKKDEEKLNATDVKKEVKVKKKKETKKKKRKISLPSSPPVTFSEFEINYKQLTETQQYEYVDMIMKENQKNNKYFVKLFKFYLNEMILKGFLETIVNYHFKKNDEGSLSRAYDIIRYMRKLKRFETMVQFANEDVKKYFFIIFEELEKREKKQSRLKRIQQHKLTYLKIIE